MLRLKAPLLGIIAVALLATTLAVPAAAQVTETGRVVFVNGIPGTRIDICVNGREIRSGLPYGRQKAKRLFAAQKLITIFKKDPRRCRGRLLARKRFDLLPDAELTVVATRGRPDRIRIFSSTDLVAGPSAAFRYAGDMGPVSLKFDMWLKVIGDEPLVPVNPVANGVAWAKGSYSSAPFPENAVVRVKARRYGRTRVIAVSPKVEYDFGRCVEWILVGTRGTNARFVLVYRNVHFV